MQHHALDQLAYHHANPDTLTALLGHRSPRFDSAQQFGAFCRIVQSYDTASASTVSPTALIINMLELGCSVDTSPRAFTPSPIPYHEEWIHKVHRDAERHAGRKAVRAWVASDVAGLSGRAAADALGLGRTMALQMIETGRRAIDAALGRAGYLRQ